MSKRVAIQLRVLYGLNVLTLSAVILLSLTAATRPTESVVEAKAFLLRGPNGKVRAKLGVGENGDLLTFYDEDGNLCGKFSSYPGASGFYVSDGAKSEIILSASSRAVEIECRQQNNTLLELQGSSRFGAVIEMLQARIGVMNENSDEILAGARSITVVDKERKPVASLPAR